MPSGLLAAIDVIALQYSFSIRLQMSDMACPDSDSAKPIFRWPVGPNSRQPIKRQDPAAAALHSECGGMAACM